MQTIVNANAHCYRNNKSEEWQFQVFSSGSRLFLEVTAKDSGTWGQGESFTVELCRDERKAQVGDAIMGIKDDLMRQMTDMVKNVQGLWQPKFQPGDIVMVDKAGSNTVKIIDPNLQVSETIEKKQVIIDNDECSCALRTLMQLGCARKRGSPSCES